MKPWLTENKESFIKQLHCQTLPHAMIFSGVTGAGKRDLGDWLSQRLLCQNKQNKLGEYRNAPCYQCKNCNLFEQRTHPDHRLIQGASSSIGIDQIRSVSRFFEKTAQLGENQVVIIEDADTMTESAANALLKTLEEPTNNSFILLLAKDAQRLLPTITSRCHHIALKPPVGSDLLVHIGCENDDPFVNLSHLAEHSDEQTYIQYQELTTQFCQFLLGANLRSLLLTILLDNPDATKWLERIISNLIRSLRWPMHINVEQGLKDKITFLVNDRSEDIWQLYCLIKAYNKQRLTFGQLNKEYALEKLLVNMFIVINQIEE